MPGRIIPLVNEEIYHIFNRGIDRRLTFTNKKEYKRFLKSIKYYRFTSPPIKLSYFLVSSQKDRERIINNLERHNSLFVEIISYVLMPNHFHILLRQKLDNGTSSFMSKLLNSYTRYFNIRHKRIGPLFLDQFKAVRIETDEQLLHVSRYIHLNPYSSYVVKTLKDLENYIWSSLPEYLNSNKTNIICEKETIRSYFNNVRSLKDFIFNQADYQRELESIEHLLIEN